MLKRRGFTLIELLVSIVLLGIVGLTMARVLTSMLRVTTAQMQLAGSQGTARTGALAIPMELREIGYDTIPNGTTTSDLEVIKANRITFHAMRGTGITCGTPTLTEFRIRKPIFGAREPLLTDGFLLFVENVPTRGDDDQWVALDVGSIDNSTCGADPAIRFTLNSPPVPVPGLGNLSLANYFVGGPIRWYERMEYGPVVDATSGRTYIGARSLSLGQNTLQPIVGPLPDSTGFTLTYYDAAGNVLDPATAPKINVRSIGISIIGSTTAPITLAGSTNRARAQSPVFTRVALRNVLRPDP